MSDKARLLAALAFATLAGAILRTWGITSQVVLDDEWHAIHKLQSTWFSITRSFGWSDHSIPLTLFYKAMAATVGLAEGRLRALQVLFGVALIPTAGWLAWKATRDAPAAALLAMLVAFSPFLVLWSRFARPYSLTLLLVVVSLSAVWAWRGPRSKGLTILAAGTAGLAAWLHPLVGIYPALACLFVFLEDAAAPSHVVPRPSWQSLRLGATTAAAMTVPLLPPLLRDYAALAGKAGGDSPDLATYDRMLAIFWGGLPDPLTGVAMALAAWGWIVTWRREPRFALFLLLLAALPPAVLTLLGAMWLQSGQNFARYLLPLGVILLFLGSVGLISIVRTVARQDTRAAWAMAACASLAFAFATPTIKQVFTLGTWYSHLDYHWDYRVRDNTAKRNSPEFVVPAFYRKLAALPPGSAPIIEAPFIHEAPFNDMAYYATFHRQPERFGMLHDLCLEGPREGEVPPNDPRFRFREFVFLQDVTAVKRSGARYLVFEHHRVRGRPFPQGPLCLEKLIALYGPPAEQDDRLAVFDLAPGGASAASPR